MRLRILGSAAGKTVPRPFCRCRVCAYAKRHGGRDLRTRTGVQIFLNGDDGVEPRYQVDLPPDIGHQMVRDRFCLERLEHLLFTHADEDHLDPKSLKYRPSILSDKSDLVPLEVYGSAVVAERLTDLDADALKMRVHTVEPFQEFEMGEFRVFSLAALHAAGTLNYVLQGEGLSVLLAWDTGWWPEETWRVMDRFKLDAVLMECTVLGEKGRDLGSHQTFGSVLRMRSRMIELGCLQEQTPFVLLHIGDNGQLTHDEAVALAEPHGITVGYDGFVLEA